MPDSLQKIAAGIGIPGSKNLIVQPDEDDIEDWGSLIPMMMRILITC